jgi:glycine cleavage system aminomethyltransferase T
VAGMMRRYPTLDNRVPMSMAANLGILLDPTTHEITPFLATLIVCVSPHQRSFRGSLIAAPARRHEDNRRQQIVFTKRAEQDGGRHFRHVKFHKSNIEFGRTSEGTPAFPTMSLLKSSFDLD